MKKLFLIFSLAFLSGIATAQTQQDLIHTINMDIVSGDRVYMPIPANQSPIRYSWTTVSGNVHFQNVDYGSAIVVGSGSYIFIYEAVYADHINRRTVVGKFITRGGSGGSGGSGNDPLLPTPIPDDPIPAW